MHLLSCYYYHRSGVVPERKMSIDNVQKYHLIYDAWAMSSKRDMFIVTLYIVVVLTENVARVPLLWERTNRLPENKQFSNW